MPKEIGRRKFVNYYFTKYLSEAISNIRTEQLPYLDATDRLNITNRHKFLHRATLEEKLFLLGKLGYPFVLLIGDKSKQHSVPKLFKLFRMFLTRKIFDKKQVVREMKDMNAFAICDVDIVRSLSLAASIYNTPLYNMVNLALAANQRLAGREVERLTREMSAAQEFDTMIVRALCLGFRKYDQNEFETLYRIPPKHFIILAYLAAKRHATDKALSDHIGASYSGSDMHALMSKGFVVRKAVQPAIYTLTGAGELALIEARKYFIRHI